MFYFLICQSSITEYYDTEKKYLTSFFWGTIAYIFSHALFSSSNMPFVVQLKKSFWFIFMVDIGVVYYMYQYIKDKDSADSDTTMVDNLLQKMSLNMSKIDQSIQDNNMDNNDDSEVSNDVLITDNESHNESHNNNDSTKITSISTSTSTNIKDLLSDDQNTSFSTPISQLDNIQNINGVDDVDNINDDKYDIDLNEYEDDSGSDIDVDNFDEYLQKD